MSDWKADQLQRYEEHVKRDPNDLAAKNDLAYLRYEATVDSKGDLVAAHAHGWSYIFSGQRVSDGQAVDVFRCRICGKEGEVEV